MWCEPPRLQGCIEERKKRASRNMYLKKKTKIMNTEKKCSGQKSAESDFQLVFRSTASHISLRGGSHSINQTSESNQCQCKITALARSGAMLFVSCDSQKTLSAIWQGNWKTSTFNICTIAANGTLSCSRVLWKLLPHTRARRGMCGTACCESTVHSCTRWPRWGDLAAYK